VVALRQTLLLVVVVELVDLGLALAQLVAVARQKALLLWLLARTTPLRLELGERPFRSKWELKGKTAYFLQSLLKVAVAV
jgi:hypothetical protein